MGFHADLNGLNYERLNLEKEEFEDFFFTCALELVEELD